MTTEPDFEIKSTGQISAQFVGLKILTFKQAALFVRHLPYGRNKDKSNLASVFTDGCGTCGTKHALLKQLADENNFSGLRLTVGLFKMNGKNTPAVGQTLRRNNLDYIPEAHCYLKYNDQILDYTKPNARPADFIDDLIEETEILPGQITDHKVTYHKNYLASWLNSNAQLNLAMNELWTIREQCIQDLADN